MVTALNSRSPCPDLSPGQGHFVVFLGKTISQCLTPPRTSIPSRGGGGGGGRNTPSRFMRLGLSSNRDKLQLNGLLGSNPDLFVCHVTRIMRTDCF